MTRYKAYDNFITRQVQRMRKKKYIKLLKPGKESTKSQVILDVLKMKINKSLLMIMKLDNETKER